MFGAKCEMWGVIEESLIGMELDKNNNITKAVMLFHFLIAFVLTTARGATGVLKGSEMGNWDILTNFIRS